MSKSTEKDRPTQIGLHSLKQMLGDQSRTSLFSDQHREFAGEFGIELENQIDRFGVDLTEMEHRIAEAILRGFSMTGYKGNLCTLSREELVREKFSGKVPPAYSNVRQIPRLRATQAEILDWAGVERGSIARWSRAVEAIESLGTKQYCFYYDRAVLDDRGVPLKDSRGKWKKEQVVAVDTLFTIQGITDENTGKIKYYDITPSVIFLDQRETYFILVPYGWRDEVRRLYGDKKASSYTFLFLMFLRYQYEVKRRSINLTPPYELKWAPEEICRALRMPSTVYRRNKARALEILRTAYQVAKELAYISRYEIQDYVHVLVLNDRKFHRPSKQVSQDAESATQQADLSLKPKARQLFETFHELRKRLDPGHKSPDGQRQLTELLLLEKLADDRSMERIKEVIAWSIEKSFWCSRLSTVNKLVKHFDEALAEMLVDQKRSSSAHSNRALAEQISGKIASSRRGVRVEVLNAYVEIGASEGVYQPHCIGYDDRDFRRKLAAALARYRCEGDVLDFL